MQIKVHNLTSRVFSLSHTERTIGEKHIIIALQLGIIDHGVPQKSMQMEITFTGNTKTVKKRMNLNLTSVVFSPSYTKIKPMSIALRLIIINHGAPQKLMQMEITSTENTNIATLKPELEPIGRNFTRNAFFPSRTEI